MRRISAMFWAAALGLAALPLGAGAFHPCPGGACPQPCEPGYTIVQEICYQDVIKKVCKVVPDVKKTTKWVYDCKTEDFCVGKCSIHGLNRHKGCDQCASCMQCSKPMTKTLLIKRMVVEECPSEKCVVETVVEKVAYVVHRKVPCAAPAPCVPGTVPETVPAPKTTPPATQVVAPAAPTANVVTPLPIGPATTPAPTTVEITPPLPVPGGEVIVPVIPSPSIPVGR